MTNIDLPSRHGPRPRTHKAPPHTQLDAEPDKELIDQLASLCFSLSHVNEAPTRISVTGTRALVADAAAPFDANRSMIGREFAHIHPDGSMHLSLPANVATAAVDAGWAEPHPMAAHMAPGMVMLYTPRSTDELDTIWGLVRASHSFVMTAASPPIVGRAR